MRSIKIASGAVLLGLLVWACSSDVGVDDLAGGTDAGADSKKSGDDSTGDDSTGDDDTADATTDDSSTPTDGSVPGDSGPGYTVGGNLTGLFMPPVGDAGADSGVADSGITDSGVKEGGVADAGPPPPPPGAVILQNNAGDDLVLTANGAFTFAKKVAMGGAYAVTVKGQPSAPSQTCTVSGGGTGTANANVTNVAVNCVRNSFNVGGTVAGLSSGTLVLQNNGGDDKSITANGAYTFATKMLSGDGYTVTVKTQPVGLLCSVTNAAGTVGAANVADANITCGTFKNCLAIKTANAMATSGLYDIDPDGAGGNAPIKAYCDMTTSGGGWTQIYDQNADYGGTGAGYLAFASWATTNTANPDSGQYSIINLAPNLKAAADYEFMLTWTGGNVAAGANIQWKQTQDPNTVLQAGTVTTSNVVMSPAGQNGCGAFAGLAKNNANAYMSGERNGCYWWAVGQATAYPTGPARLAAYRIGATEYGALRSKLWIR